MKFKKNQFNQSRFAKKSLGQNFLNSLEIREKIIAEAPELENKPILEIGPGLGFLTERLLEEKANLTAVELDDRVIPKLKSKFSKYKNFKLIHQDILQLDLDEVFQEKSYGVIANIPYNITGPILRKLLEKTQNKPEFIILMVQKEVGEKICPPQIGEKRKKWKRSILSISVEIFAEAKYCFFVGRNNFDPAPKVDSAIIHIKTRKKPLIEENFLKDFFTVINAGFSEKRKKLSNSLGKFFGIESQKLLGDIDGNLRAETLEITDWIKITENFRKIMKCQD